MSKPFFVMLYHPRGHALPLVENDDGDVLFFADSDEARKIANQNILGRQCGFEIHCMGEGCGE